MKYLDKTGLAYLWGKIIDLLSEYIPTMISNPQDSAAAFTDEEGITIGAGGGPDTNVYFTLGVDGNANIDATGKFKYNGVEIATLDDVGGSANWDDIQGKPEVFPPEAHTHTTADITDAISGEVLIKTSASATISKDSWTARTDTKISIEPGTWIVHGYGYFRSKTTGTGSTDSSAGYRTIRIGDRLEGSSSDGNISGTISKEYVGSGQAAYVQTCFIRKFQNSADLWIDVHSSTQVGLDNARIEAVRIK